MVRVIRSQMCCQCILSTFTPVPTAICLWSDHLRQMWTPGLNRAFVPHGWAQLISVTMDCIDNTHAVTVMNAGHIADLDEQTTGITDCCRHNEALENNATLIQATTRSGPMRMLCINLAILQMLSHHRSSFYRYCNRVSIVQPCIRHSMMSHAIRGCHKAREESN